MAETASAIPPTDQNQERLNMRAAANNVILHLHPTRVPAGALRFTYTWGLGGISALLAVMLVATGVLLMFRYEPSVENAYTSIQQIETQVAFGSLVRAVHHWSANLLVITAFLHLVRIFYTGGFMRGRTMNWLIGLALLLLVLAFNFTGYLLPWDQLAYWAITVGTNLLNYIPLIGTHLNQVLLAGPEVGQPALSNFYALHVAVLPVILLAALSYHFWKIRKNGGISQPLPRPGTSVISRTTIPNLVQIEMAAAALVFTGVIIWAMLRPAPLLALADPTHSPNPAKAAWYFLGVQELLLHMHPLAAMILIGLVLAGLVLLPRSDPAGERIGHYFRSRLGRRTAVVGLLLAIYTIPLLVIIDEYWLDWSALMPGWPVFVAIGLVPLLLTLGGLALIYAGLHLVSCQGQRADHSEALVGLFTFVMTSIILLTLVSFYFRGPNMALVLPF